MSSVVAYKTGAMETYNDTTSLIRSHCRNFGSGNDCNRPSAGCASICIPRQLTKLPKQRRIHGRTNRHRTIVVPNPSGHISVGVSPILSRARADHSQALLENSECTVDCPSCSRGQHRTWTIRALRNSGARIVGGVRFGPQADRRAGGPV